MGIDLFSLRMNLETTGAAAGVAGLRDVEAAGQRTASALGGLNTANNTVKMGWMEQQSAIARLSTTQENLRNGVFRIQNDVKSASAAYKAGSISVDDYRTALTTANTHLLNLGTTSNLSEKQLKAYRSTLKESAVGMKELEAATVPTVGAFDRMAGTVSKFLIGFFAARAVMGFLKDSALAAADADRSNVKLQMSVQATGLSWVKYKDQLMAASMETQRKTIFSDEAQKDSMAKLILVTKDVGEALRLQSVAADLATFKGIGLVQATDTLVRVQAGYTRVVREFGITTKDGTEAIAQLAALLQGQASAGAETFNGKLKILTNQWSEFKESLGNLAAAAGLPEFLTKVNHGLETMTGWLGKLTGHEGFKLNELTMPQLTAKLAELRAAGAGSPTGDTSMGAWWTRLKGGTPGLVNQSDNMQEQIAVQKEMVFQEQSRILRERMARSEAKAESEEHIKDLSDAFKLGILTRTEDAERLKIIRQIAADLHDTTDLKERIKLQGQLADLTGKQLADTERLHRLELMMGNPAQAPDDLGSPFGGRIGTRNDRIDITGSLHAPAQRGAVGGQMGALIQAGEATRQQFSGLGRNLGLAVVTSFSQAMAAGLQGKNPFKAFGQAILGALGGIMLQMGQAMIAQGIVMTNLLPALMNPFTSGPALIAAGVILSALGMTLGGIASGSGGGGGKGGSVPKDTVTQIHLTADGAGGWMAPHAKDQPVYKVLGKDSPEGQRLFAEYSGKAARRGF